MKALLLFLLLFGNTAAANQLAKPKHIFLISIDTLSARHMSLFGYHRNTTPELAELAKEALVFNQAWSQATFTMPSHMTMFTGLYPHNHNVMQDYVRARLPAHIKTLPEILRNAGYKTHSVNDLLNPMLNPIIGFGRGIDQFHSVDVFDNPPAGTLKKLLESAKGGNNFYFIHTDAVHDPYVPEPPFDKMFTKYNSKVPPFSEFKEASKQSEWSRWVRYVEKWRAQFDYTNPEHVEIMKALYDGAIASADHKVGEFIKMLKELGLYEESLIVIVGDHGEVFGERGHFWHVHPYTAEIHVPLIIRYPGVKPARFDERVLLTDIVPTILEVAGLKPQAALDGYSLVPDKDGKIKTHDIGFSMGVDSYAVFDKQWKFLKHVDGADELYRISDGPDEKNNLIKEFPEVALKLRAEYEKATLKSESTPAPRIKPAKKLYWFIPDGMRAEATLFNVYQWAREGKLPNILRMMSEGSSGYSIPDFPSHTPINFASLLTGTHPEVHGIADGPMHIEGQPLAKPSAPGFSSVTKRVTSIWKEMFNQGKKVFLLSIPGSTPPEIPQTVVKGRWGNWGSDTTNIVFESDTLFEKRKNLGNAFKLFFLGEPLTRFVPVTKTRNGMTAKLSAHGAELPVNVNAKKSTVTLSLGGKDTEVKAGEWSEWLPVELKYKNAPFQSFVKISPIKIWKDGKFRIRVIFNGINEFNTEPGNVAGELTKGIGPMVDYLDNWPPQLIFEQEDKRVSMDEVRMSLDWHRKAAAFIPEKYKPDVFIQDTYTPNQMLESRWWHKELDPANKGYSEVKAKNAMKDILEMYQGLDAIIGEAIAKKDEDTLIVLSSDHGVCELKRLVHLNNLFAKKGWLKFSVDAKTGEAKIDWNNTKVVYLKMLHVYINPDGLGGNFKRASGPAFEKLRDEVIETLKELKDINGTKPLVRAVKNEDAKATYKLPQDRIGDLVIEARLNYFWYEEADNSQKIFSTPMTSGYKQSIDPLKNNCMWTPFVMWGPGVKKGFQFEKPIAHVDQLPTIYKIMNVPLPKHLQGRVLEEALQ